MTRWLAGLMFIACFVGWGGLGAAAAATTTITVASGAGVSPPPFGTVQDLYVEVSLDGGVNWTPAYAADPAGLWPVPLTGTSWVTPGANQFQGYGEPQTILYRVSFILPAGATNPALSGFFAGDDQRISVALNGTVIANYPYVIFQYDPTPLPFATADATLFVTGTNVLVFEILNLGGATSADFLGLVSYESGPSLPTTKDECKHGGWQSFGVFKNQGDCVSFVATGGKNQPAN